MNKYKEYWNEVARRNSKKAIAGRLPEDQFWDSGEKCVNWVLSLIEKQLPLTDYNILDIGCGIGRLGVVFESMGASVLGVDISEEMIKQYQGKNGLVVDNSFSLLEKKELSKTFDLCLMFLVALHIDNLDTWKWMHTCSQLLKPNGSLVVMFSALEFGSLADTYVAMAKGNYRSDNANRTRVYSKSEIELLLPKFGFQIKSCERNGSDGSYWIVRAELNETST